MNLNVENFKDILRKATVNYLIESVQLKVTEDTVKSKMISQSNDCISILDIENEFITNMNKINEYEFNFLEPAQTIIPYLNLIDTERETTIKIMDEKITLITGNQKSNIFFCSPRVVNVFTADSLRDDIEYFTNILIDDNFIGIFNKIKKIAPRFGKIYFDVTDKIFSIETTDKQNSFSNGVKFDLGSVDNDNISLCFNYKNIAGIMSIIDNTFSAGFAYSVEQEMGMIYFTKEENTEKYYLMSNIDR